MNSVTLRDGVTLPVRLRGAGRPVLFVHGWAMTGALFEDAAERLRDIACSITLDLRGHGRASNLGPMTVETLGADLADVAEALGLHNAIACGWSMGAMAVWSAAAHPGFARRMAGYVVIDMSPRLPNDSGWSLGLADGRDLQTTLKAADAMRADWPGAVARFTPRILAEGGDQTPLCKRLAATALEQDADSMAALWESMARQDFRARLKSISAPTLAVYGEKSQLYREGSSRFIARECPLGRAIGFQHSGHAPHLEEPERFAAVLRDFIAMTAKDSASARPAGASV